MKLRVSAVISAAAVLVAGAFAAGHFFRTPLIAEVQAQTAAMHTGRAAYHVETESYDHEAGVEMLYLAFDGVQFTDGVPKPLDKAHQVCHATCRVATLGAQCMGYCSAVDDDGDVAWVTWDRVDETGGTWKFLGGTGKYEGETGGGNWTVGGQQGPHMVSNTWARNY